MTKKYQTTEFDTSALAVPEQVSVAMNEIAADMREGLLALAVGAGLQVMQQLMEADVTAACGPRGQARPGADGEPARHRGRVRSPWVAGGCRSARPRVRAADGSGEVPVPAYELFNGTELLGRMAMERMLGRALDPPLPGRAGAGRRGRSRHVVEVDAASRRCRGSSWR